MGLAFATFSVEEDKPQNRLQLSFTLVLTTVTFKDVVNRSLPKIPYLTYLVSQAPVHGIFLGLSWRHWVLGAWHRQNLEKEGKRQSLRGGLFGSFPRPGSQEENFGLIVR